ncbi:MAG: hypothetical protein ACRD0Q_03320 [Acidimicrobiales bacterium]
MAKMQPSPLHFLTWMLAATPISTLGELIDVDPEEDLPDDLDLVAVLRAGALERWAERWPAGVVRLAIEGLWDRTYFDLEERDELMARLDDPPVAAPSEQPGEAAQKIDPTMEPGTAVADGQAAESYPAVGDPDGPGLARVLLRARDAALTPSATQAEVARHVAGVEWLVDLEPGFNACWFTYGQLLAGLSGWVEHPREPRAREARLQLLAGRLQALVDARDTTALVGLMEERREDIESVLVTPAADRLLAPLLSAYLDHPRQAARLLGLARTPFEGWKGFVQRAQSRAARLLATGSGAEAEILLRAVEDRLLRWAAAGGGDERPMEQEAVATSILRASCRRRRNDFVGSSALLANLDLALVDVEQRTSAAFEAAMAAAEIGAVEDLSFPRDDERQRLAERLERSRPRLEAVVDADPAHPEANLLLGMLASCRGDDAGTARHLGMVVDRIEGGEGARALSAAAVFHRALARLRLLEAGTDEGAHHDMAAAMGEGYVPTESELASAAVALEAHGSPRAGEYLARAVAAGPSSPAVLALVQERARSGDLAARGIVEEMAADGNRRLVERFELLDAALAGAETAGDTAAAERLAGSVDDVVVRANRPELDDRWAHALDVGESLRSALEPCHADAMRMEVLRRGGRLDEARAIATGLFHRAAAGSLAAFDAAELLAVLHELGVPGDELALLARLVHSEPPPEGLVAPGGHGLRRILFVGGNETQEQYRQRLEDEVQQRFGGDVTVEWFFSGWSSNWMKVAEGIETSLRTRAPSAVVLMTFVRTNLGQWVRRTAGEHGLPWVACTGHGRAAISRAIERAVEVSADLSRR